MATKRATAAKRKPKAVAKKRPAQTPDNCDVGAPIEHYRGERNQHGTTGDPGDVEEETLDPKAPYNRTYGR
jgi:hypothetical protein